MKTYGSVELPPGQKKKQSCMTLLRESFIVLTIYFSRLYNINILYEHDNILYKREFSHQLKLITVQISACKNVSFIRMKLYFMLGLRHGEILQLLSSLDSTVISMRTLRRNLKLHRRKNQSDPMEVAIFLDQLEGHTGILFEQ